MLILLFSKKQLYSQIFNGYGFSFQMETGFLHGTAFELVYRNSHSNNILSELQWEIKPLYFAGINLGYEHKQPLTANSWFFGINVKFGIPMETGNMEDRDWLDIDSNKPTLFSSHDNKTTFAILFDYFTGYSISFARNFIFTISIVSALMYYKFEAWNGYTQYGTNTTEPPYIPWNPNLPKNEILGLGIDYSQFWIILKPVAGIERHSEKIIIKALFAVSPVITCFTKDNHYLRVPPLYFSNTITGGIFLEPELFFIYKINERIKIGINITYTWINGNRGNMTVQEMSSSGKTITYLNCGGAGFQAFKCGILFKFTL